MVSIFERAMFGMTLGMWLYVIAEVSRDLLTTNAY